MMTEDSVKDQYNLLVKILLRKLLSGALAPEEPMLLMEHEFKILIALCEAYLEK